MLIQMLLRWLVGVYLWISEVKKSHISSSISAISLSLESSQLFKTEHLQIALEHVKCSVVVSYGISHSVV